MENKFNFNNFTVEANGQSTTRKAINALLCEECLDNLMSYNEFMETPMAEEILDDAGYIYDENNNVLSCKEVYSLLKNDEPCTIKMAPNDKQCSIDQPSVYIITAHHTFLVASMHPAMCETEWGITNWVGRAIFPDAPYEC